MNDLLDVEDTIIATLLKAACPERAQEIAAYWETFAPQFAVREDDVGMAMSARANKVTWMHKTLAHDWVITFAGMKALVAYCPHIVFAQMVGCLHKVFFDQDDKLGAAEAELDDLLYFAKEIGHVERLDDLTWQPGLPQPGTARESLPKAEDKACFDLACMAAAASLFHELRHVQFTAEGNRPADRLEEERQCDDYSRAMLVANVADYCKQSGEDVEQVASKRVIALSCAALAIGAAQSRGMQAAITDTHPPIPDRFKHLVLQADAPPHAFCWDYLACLLVAMLRRDGKLPDTIPFDTCRSLCEKLVELL